MGPLKVEGNSVWDEGRRPRKKHECWEELEQHENVKKGGFFRTDPSLPLFQEVDAGWVCSYRLEALPLSANDE